jgi:hypothetical protein
MMPTLPSKRHQPPANHIRTLPKQRRFFAAAAAAAASHCRDFNIQTIISHIVFIFLFSTRGGF